MQLSHGLTCRPSVKSVSRQESYKLQTFSGLGKLCRLCLRSVDSDSHTFAWILLHDSNLGTWTGRHIFWTGGSSKACKKDTEISAPFRNGSCQTKQLKVQEKSHHQTLYKLSPLCCSGLKEAARYACNDARIVNARAREGFVFLARGFEKLDRRARKDVALLGSGFLKLDARARQDTVKLDSNARRNAARLRSMAVGLTGRAHVQLKSAAEKHWSDGALDADLRLADLRARRRAIEDAFIALQLVKSIQNGVVKHPDKRQGGLEKAGIYSEESDYRGKHGYPRSLMYDRLAALQEAYWDIASALVEAEGIDYTDPDELELIIAALLDMDAVDGASSATMLAEWANSPDVATRQALANALGNAPSLWALGNVGIGALQRLASDNNPAVAAAASKALRELEQQWQMGPRDGLFFDAKNSFLESFYLTDEDDVQE